MKWGDIVRKLSIPMSPTNSALLLFDGYYSTEDAFAYLERIGVHYIAGVNTQRFQDLIKLHKAWAKPSAIYNFATKRLVVYHHSQKGKIGKKWVFSNAYRVTPGHTEAGEVPAFQQYGHRVVKGCDLFNQLIHGRNLGHKCGGHGTKGEWGQQHKFAMSCIIQNSFHMCKALGGTLSFEDFGKILADEIVDEALDYD